MLERGTADAPRVRPGGGQVLAQCAALRLLERSIEFEHGSLAVVRLAMAVRAGASVPAACWVYCSHVAASSGDALTRALYLEAVRGRLSPSTGC